VSTSEQNAVCGRCRLTVATLNVSLQKCIMPDDKTSTESSDTTAAQPPATADALRHGLARRGEIAEETRVVAELARAHAEQLRVFAEDARILREQYREEFELGRQQREELRRTAEDARRATEEARHATIAAVTATADSLRTSLAQMQFLADASHTLRHLKPTKPDDAQ